MRRVPERIAVLRRRDFRLLFAAQAVSGIGDRMVSLALAFAVLDLGGSVSDVGLVLAARTLPLVAFLLIGGVVADRVSRRAVMVAADVVRFASQGLLAALLIGGTAEVWTVALLSGLTGAATGFFIPASTGLLRRSSSPSSSSRLTGCGRRRCRAGRSRAPRSPACSPRPWAPAGRSASTRRRSSSAPRCWRRCGCRGEPSASRPPSSPTCATAGPRSLPTRGCGRSWRAPRPGTLFWASWSVLGPVVADRELGGPAVWGSIIAALGTGALLGGLAAIAIRPRRPLVVSTVAFALFVIPLALLAAGAPAWLVAAGAMAGGAGMMLGNSIFEATLQRLMPAESLSRVSAYDWFGSLAFQPLGMAIWGPISVAIGIHEALWLASGLLLALALAVLAVRDIRRVTLPSGRYS